MGGRRGTEGKAKQSSGHYCLCEVWRGHQKHMVGCGDCAPAQTLPLHLHPTPLGPSSRTPKTPPHSPWLQPPGVAPPDPAVARGVQVDLSPHLRPLPVQGPRLQMTKCLQPAAPTCPGSPAPCLLDRGRARVQTWRRSLHLLAMHAGERENPDLYLQPRLFHLLLRHWGPQWFFLLPWANEPQPSA